jgi:hypothetical protein
LRSPIELMIDFTPSPSLNDADAITPLPCCGWGLCLSSDAAR